MAISSSAQEPAAVQRPQPLQSHRWHGEESPCLTGISFTDVVFSYIKSTMAVFHNKENKHLTAEERRKVSAVKCDELFAVGSFFSQNFGCWHSRIEAYCAFGFMSRHKLDHDSRFVPCKTL